MLYQDGRTALHFAATFAKDDVVKLLLNRKADQTIPGGVSIYFKYICRSLKSPRPVLFLCRHHDANNKTINDWSLIWDTVRQFDCEWSSYTGLIDISILFVPKHKFSLLFCMDWRVNNVNLMPAPSFISGSSEIDGSPRASAFSAIELAMEISCKILGLICFCVHNLNARQWTSQKSWCNKGFNEFMKAGVRYIDKAEDKRKIGIFYHSKDFGQFSHVKSVQKWLIVGFEVITQQNLAPLPAIRHYKLYFILTIL